MQDYAEKFVPKLTGQFTDSPKLKGMVKAIMDALTELETQADELTTERWIDTAIGKQLDGCGYIVGEPRQGRDDDAYREAIKFRVFVNIAKGTPSTLIQGLKFLTKPSDCQYLESYPATAILFTNGYPVPTNIHDQMQGMAPVAISDVPVAVSYGQKPFRFSKTSTVLDFFKVNTSRLKVNGAFLKVTKSGDTEENGSRFGGIVPARLKVNGSFLSLGTKTLAVYNPNQLTLLGSDNLTGVYQ